MGHIKRLHDEDTGGALILLHIGGEGRNWMLTFTGDMINLTDSNDLDAEAYWEVYKDEIVDRLNELIDDRENGKMREYTDTQIAAMDGMAPIHIN